MSTGENVKQTADGVVVSDRSYYYLLDWNEKDNGNFIAGNYGKSTIKELTFAEYKRVFIRATVGEFAAQNEALNNSNV